MQGLLVERQLRFPATRRAVPAMSCIKPTALATLLASGLKADSSRMMPT